MGVSSLEHEDGDDVHKKVYPVEKWCKNLFVIDYNVLHVMPDTYIHVGERDLKYSLLY